MVRDIFCILFVYHAIRDDELNAGCGKRDVHVSRARQIQKAVFAQEKSLSARFQAVGFQAKS